jgi:hypothetical protein
MVVFFWLDPYKMAHANETRLLMITWAMVIQFPQV